MFAALKTGVGYFRTFKPKMTDGLDLSYIPTGAMPIGKDGNSRVIAMCGPALSSVEYLIRNDADDVVNYFRANFDIHYAIYNLREQDYPGPMKEKFEGFVHHIPIPDHNVPKFTQMFEFCHSAKSFLAKDARNVIAVHCKAGKGRTGTMITCFLIYTQAYPTADQALEVFSKYRSELTTIEDVDEGVKDLKHRGVDQASQLRWVRYFEQLLSEKREKRWTDIECIENLDAKEDYISRIDVRDYGDIATKPPYTLQISQWGYKTSPGSVLMRLSHPKVYQPKADERILTYFCKSIRIQGEIKLEFWEKGLVNDKQFCRLWIHPYFIQGGTLTLAKGEIDDVWNSKTCDPRFSISVHFGNSHPIALAATPANPGGERGRGSTTRVTRNASATLSPSNQRTALSLSSNQREQQRRVTTGGDYIDTDYFNPGVVDLAPAPLVLARASSEQTETVISPKQVHSNRAVVVRQTADNTAGTSDSTLQSARAQDNSESTRETFVREVFDETALTTILNACVPLPSDILRIIVQYGALFLNINLDKDCDGAEVGRVFPSIQSQHWGNLAVKAGVLTINADGAQIGMVFDEVFGGAVLFNCSALEYSLAVSCNAAMYNRGLGCYLEAASSRACPSRASKHMNRLCYHPGMHGGQLRMEGPGGHNNKDLGWTPNATEDGSSLQIITLRVAADGVHRYTITSSDGQHRSEGTWTNTLLVEPVSGGGGGICFPSFGMYPSDLKGQPGAKVFFSNFRVCISREGAKS